MKRKSFVYCLLTGITFLAVAGCSKKGPEGSAGQSGEAQHASSSVVPGSYEDWCGEHQVAESQCTRCDPSLIAAFQATNDWCAEHGLPESQCLICHPDLKIVRPPKPEGQ